MLSIPVALPLLKSVKGGSCVSNLAFIFARFLLTDLWFGSPPDEDVKRYCEKLNRDPEPPVQVNQVDSCFHRTLERVGLTLYDDPEGQYCTKKCFLL